MHDDQQLQTRASSPTPSIFLTCLLGLVAGGIACQGEQDGSPYSSQSTQTALPVETIRVESSDHYTVDARHVGRVLARRTSDLGFTRSDRLIEVLVDEGDQVEAGAPLARLDTARLAAQRTEWIAQRREVQARLDLARLTLERRKELAGKDSISTQRFDEARFEAIALEARFASIEAGLERVEIDIAQSQIVAPFAGSITDRAADEGAILAPGAPVVTLVESGVMEVRVGVPPALAARLKVGDTHTLEVDGVRFDAPIAAIRRDVSLDTRTVTVVLPIEGTHAELARHGALARLIVHDRREAQGFWLPITALTESRRGMWGAFVLEPAEFAGPNTFIVARQELMMVHVESDRAFVRGTLVDGDEVVVTGLQRIAPGQRVQRTESHDAVRSSDRS